MRTQEELNQFIVLRSNGWSLAKISKHLNIPRTTLFRWEGQNADTIHLFKYVQLEKIQEQYVPSYEEQLKDTHEHLAKIQAALKKRDYSFMSSEFLLQMNFQLQNRLDRIRQQVPLRPPQFDTPMEAFPPIGCVTKDETFPREPDSDPDPTVEGEPFIRVHPWSKIKNKTEHFGTKTPGGSKMDPCKSTTSNTQNGTPVPFRKEKNE